MDEWLSIVIRQLILYSLPLLVSLTLVGLAEARIHQKQSPYPFYAIAWRGCWLPFLTALMFHRGIIIALPNPIGYGIKPAVVRVLVHTLLCTAGFLLYTWSLSHQAPAGLPPLHHWWAKVLMFFNLCMAALHLLPLPLLLVGELGRTITPLAQLQRWRSSTWIILAVLVATPLLDLSLGAFIIYPTYEWMSTMAVRLAG